MTDDNSNGLFYSSGSEHKFYSFFLAVFHIMYVMTALLKCCHIYFKKSPQRVSKAEPVENRDGVIWLRQGNTTLHQINLSSKFFCCQSAQIQLLLYDGYMSNKNKNITQKCEKFIEIILLISSRSKFCEASSITPEQIEPIKFAGLFLSSIIHVLGNAITSSGLKLLVSTINHQRQKQSQLAAETEAVRDSLNLSASKGKYRKKST